MKKVLITRALQPIAAQLLSKQFEVVVNPTDIPMTHEELIGVVQSYDAILSMLGDVFTKDVLAKASRVKVISNFAIGLDNVDLAFAKQAGIAVYNVTDVVTNSTADLTMALFLALLRKIPEGQAYVRQGQWIGWEPGLFLGEELEGKTFGIIGYGRIGRAVAKRAKAFGMRVVVYHRRKMDEVEQLEWDEFLGEVDYLSLHVPLTQDTHGMIDMEAIKKMKKRPVLINMARGPVVDTDALVVALEEGLLRGAALDVTCPEPISAAHPLCHMDNCMITPHLGTATIECRTEMARRAAQSIIDFYEKS